jgi:hypothetical protein
MKQPMWDSKSVKAYETGQGVELVNEPYPHYVPSNKCDNLLNFAELSHHLGHEHTMWMWLLEWAMRCDTINKRLRDRK